MANLKQGCSTSLKVVHDVKPDGFGDGHLYIL